MTIILTTSGIELHNIFGKQFDPDYPNAVWYPDSTYEPELL